jgi:RimJ/RimL family protein N-acetyltransferase
MTPVVQRLLRGVQEAAETPVQCSRDRHELQMPGLRLQTPTTRDVPMLLAAGSDPQAQQWLGWHHRQLQPDPYRERLLAGKPRRGRIPYKPPGSQYLIAVDPESGHLAGSIAYYADTDHQGTGEIGGCLAPRFRGRGLGVSLFAGAAIFAHQHLGIGSVTAGTEPGNIACVAALTSAGFIPASGPGSHTLPNGRVVPALWFRHETARPTTCMA